MKNYFFTITFLSIALIFGANKYCLADTPFVVEGIYVTDWDNSDGTWTLVCEPVENSVCAIGIIGNDDVYSINVDPNGISKSVDNLVLTGSCSSLEHTEYYFRSEQ
jgi:hypothetical protein